MEVRRVYIIVGDTDDTGFYLLSITFSNWSQVSHSYRLLWLPCWAKVRQGGVITSHYHGKKFVILKGTNTFVLNSLAYFLWIRSYYTKHEGHLCLIGCYYFGKFSWPLDRGFILEVMDEPLDCFYDVIGESWSESQEESSQMFSIRYKELTLVWVRHVLDK